MHAELSCALPRCAGWIAGPIILFGFAWVTYFCSALLIDAYRYPNVDSPQVNYKYIDAVERYMGVQHAHPAISTSHAPQKTEPRTYNGGLTALACDFLSKQMTAHAHRRQGLGCRMRHSAVHQHGRHVSPFLSLLPFPALRGFGAALTWGRGCLQGHWLHRHRRHCRHGHPALQLLPLHW